ncbi:MAG: DUF927 domain-containing protein [Lachnospirales bacterium]
MKEQINIDSFIDYKTEYTSVIKKHHISGDKLTGLCPFHNDRNSSFSADLKTGQWYCFAENKSGNFITFYAELNNVSTKDAYNTLLDKYGISKDDKPTKPSYTLSQYAFEKRLPDDWLKEFFHLANDKGKDGVTYIKMPYYNEKGQETTFRKRFANKEFKWKYGSSGKICLYNEWSLESIRNVGSVVLVEGESDTQTLVYLGIPVLGVPGASLFKPHQVKLLQDLKVYIHKEPDQGGETFFSKVTKCLKDGEFIGEVYVWSCKQFGVKDPSEVYLKMGKDNAAKAIRKAIKNAEKIDIFSEVVPNVISDQPLGLRQPEGWIYSDKGISEISEKKIVPTLVCRTPIIITKRLRSIETNEEKIEVSFKRDGKWHSAIYPRSTIFTNRGITVLADLGCTVTSENAKSVVKFLSALEAENIDIIPIVQSVSSFGWQTGNRFIPGHEKGIVLDIDPTQKGLAMAYCQSGTYDEWILMIKPHRKRDKFRFILAASFAAPLLKIIRQRIFFVYNWGGSKGGKTAALKAALSVWGEPERLMINFNATQVGLERTAAFYCDLPLGIDERQLAGNNSNAQNSLEKSVYMIASGQGKIRGSKGGGLQHTHQWRTIAIATGEEPIATNTSQTGVSTRTIEIYGGPFEDEAEASIMHQMTAINYGWAGNDFIDHILKSDELAICELYKKMTKFVQGISGGKSGSHVAGIAAVALADALADHWIFNKADEIEINEKSWQRAEKMAEAILNQQLSTTETDVNENAAQFIVDWIMSNKSCFGSNTIGTCFGYISGNKAYIYPSILNNALSKNGYSPRKTMRYLADKGVIASKTNGHHTVYSLIKFFDGRNCRFIEFNMKDYSEEKDPLICEDELSEQNSENDFIQISIDDDELPF